MVDMAERGSGQCGKGIVRVLIADDRKQSRDGLRALLSTCPNVEVVGDASNGEDAIRLVGERHPAVVLMDIRMGGLDGLDATRWIKMHCPEIRVIALTMYSSFRLAAMTVGADAFLVKGCSTEELLAAIGTLPPQTPVATD